MDAVRALTATDISKFVDLSFVDGKSTAASEILCSSQYAPSQLFDTLRRLSFGLVRLMFGQSWSFRDLNLRPLK